MKLKRKKAKREPEYKHEQFSKPDELGMAYDEQKGHIETHTGCLQTVKEDIFKFARDEGIAQGKRKTVKGKYYEVGIVTVTKTGFNEFKLKKAVGQKVFDAMRSPVTKHVFDQRKIKALLSSGKVKTATLKACLEIENTDRVYVKSLKGGTEDESQEEISEFLGL